MPDTPLVSTVGPLAGAGAGLAAGAAFGGPVGMAVGAGVGALIALIGDIGSGRRTANTMTQNGGPQDIINKQLAAIAASGASDADKAQATQVAWQGFIQATNQFAAQGKEQAQVAKQAIYQTPALTQTVQSLMGGVDPLGQQFTSQMSPSIASATPQSGIGLGQLFGNAAAGAAGGFAGGQLQGAGTAASAVDGGESGVSQAGTATASAAGIDGAAGGVDEYGNQIFTPSQTAALTSAEGGTAGATAGTAGAAASSTGSSSLLSKIFPSLISGGTSLIGAAIGSNAASNAASLQAAAANHAADLQAQAAAASLAFQKQTLAQQQQNIQPWITAGTNALSKINSMAPYALPTAEEAAQTPGYQFQFQQGENALEAYERANGTLVSGKALKEIDQYGQGVASSNYQNVVGNSLAAYNANLNPQLSIAGLGQVSTSGLNNNLSTAAGLNTNTNLTSATNIGNAQQQAAQATASGYVGGANSWLNALQNIGNNAVQQSGPTVQQLIQALQAKNSAASIGT